MDLRIRKGLCGYRIRIMCGIAGIAGATSPDREVLDRMQRCLDHRGPDDHGVYVDGTVGLAHRRLSIIDPDSEGQPLSNEDGSVRVIFNGEIYNYRTLRSRLRDLGHRFATDTDTEVLVHLYEEHGRSFVDRLEGMFAFALWDRTERDLVLARDPMGIKPLLIGDDGTMRAFASELDPLFETDLDLGGIDTVALAAYFALGYVPAPQTIFENVRKLQPGHLAVISDGTLRTERFYTPSIPARNPDLDTAGTELATRIRDAVERRLMADVPLGAFLSGGIDSSIVVALMAQATSDPVETFTVGFEEDRFDERWAARELADHYDTDHSEFVVTVDDVRELIPSVTTRLGEPFADPSLLPTYVVARETGRNVKVALSGDGGDELFAGYTKYRGELLSRYLRRMPGPLQTAVRRSLEHFPASRTSLLGERTRQARDFMRAGGIQTDPVRHFHWNRTSTQDLFVDGHRADSVGQAAFEQYYDGIQDMLPPDRRDSLSTMQAVDTRHALPDQILHKVDTASMLHSLEVRTPLLDTSVVEYAMSLPRRYKITPRTQKRVLKRAFEDQLPTEIIERQKSGFDVPLGHWFKHDLADDFRGTLRETETDLLDKRAIRESFERHCDGRQAAGKFLWSVYVFCRWFKRMRRRDIL